MVIRVVTGITEMDMTTTITVIRIIMKEVTAAEAAQCRWLSYSANGVATMGRSIDVN